MTRRPIKVIFILADDLGWRDTSVFGSTVCETPNIDRLAARGMRFIQAYAACPLCSPHPRQHPNRPMARPPRHLYPQRPSPSSRSRTEGRRLRPVHFGKWGTSVDPPTSP